MSLHEDLSLLESQYIRCVAYQVDPTELEAVFRGENGQPDISLDVCDLGLRINEWRALGIPWSSDGTLGKYNAILRLGDINGRPSYTITTARDLPPDTPSDDYQWAIRQALKERMSDEDATGYLARFVTQLNPRV